MAYRQDVDFVVHGFIYDAASTAKRLSEVLDVLRNFHEAFEGYVAAELGEIGKGIRGGAKTILPAQTVINGSRISNA